MRQLQEALLRQVVGQRRIAEDAAADGEDHAAMSRDQFGERMRVALARQLLEAPDLKSRAETLVAITEMALARDKDDFGSSLQ